MKRLLTALAILIALLTSVATSAQKTQLMQEDISYVNVLKYGIALNSTTLNAAITAIGSAKRTLILTTGNWILSANVTVPSTLFILIPAGTTVTVNGGFTLTFNGRYFAYQKDWYTGTVVFNNKPFSEPEAFNTVFNNYIVSGGFHGTSASLTSPSFATSAWIRGYNIVETARTLTYVAAANDVVWVIIGSVTTGITGWTQIGSTNYYYQAEGDTTPTQPTLPANSTWLMGPITITASAIAAVIDKRDRVISTDETLSTSFTTASTVLWRILPNTTVTVATGVTVTVAGVIEAPCISGKGWITLQGSGVLLFSKSRTVCPEWWGAYSDNTNESTTVTAINNALESLQTNGGVVKLGVGTYKVQGVDAAGRAILIKRNNITLTGSGRHSVIQATNNTDTVVCISPNSDCSANTGTNVSGVTISNVFIKGTGTGAYSALLAGRGILGARTANLMIHDNFVEDMSMICIALNSGGGEYTTISRNHLTNCFFTGINFNGPASQSIIEGNVIAGIRTVGVATPIAIQVDGNAVVANNTIYDSDGYGILHGEGNYDGTTIIANNFLKKLLQACIQGAYHGAVSILGNRCINATGGTAAIAVSGDTSIFPIPAHNCLIHDNHIINSLPVGIYSSSPRCSIQGNKITRMSSAINTGGTTATLIDITAAYVTGIVIQGANNFVGGNTIDGAIHGLGVHNSITDTSFGLNQFLTMTTGEFSAINSAGTVNATATAPVSGGGRILEGGISAATTGPVRSVNWQVNNTNPSSGQPIGWIITSHIVTNTSGASSGTAITVSSTTGMATNDRIMVVNSQGDFTAQYRNLVTVDTATQITVDSAITVVSGEILYADRWKPLVNLP